MFNILILKNISDFKFGVDKVSYINLCSEKEKEFGYYSQLESKLQDVKDSKLFLPFDQIRNINFVLEQAKTKRFVQHFYTEEPVCFFVNRIDKKFFKIKNKNDKYKDLFQNIYKIINYETKDIYFVLNFIKYFFNQWIRTFDIIKDNNK